MLPSLCKEPGQQQWRLRQQSYGMGSLGAPGVAHHPSIPRYGRRAVPAPRTPLGGSRAIPRHAPDALLGGGCSLRLDRGGTRLPLSG